MGALSAAASPALLPRLLAVARRPNIRLRLSSKFSAPLIDVEFPQRFSSVSRAGGGTALLRPHALVSDRRGWRGWGETESRTRALGSYPTSGARGAEQSEGEEKGAGGGRGELLYARSPDRRTMPRFLLGFSAVHTSYWLWYALDFMPAVNAAAERARAAGVEAGNPAADLISGIDPTIGYVGLFIALLMGVGSVAYPRHLVSEIRAGDAPGGLRIKVYDLPFVTVEGGEGTVYAPGEVRLENVEDANKILGKHAGDISLFRGHMGLSAPGFWGNLLLDINEKDDVRQRDVLLNSILPDGMRVPVVGGFDRGAGRSRRKADSGRKGRAEMRKLARNLQRLRQK